MKYSFLILIAFIMNACMMQPATEEEINDMSLRAKSGTLTPGAGQKIVFQANLKSDPGNYTLQFSIQNQIPTAAVQYGTQATVRWSVGGNSVTRVIDIVDGTSISGTAEHVEVAIVDTTANPGGSPYVVAVQVAKGTRASVQQPPYLTAGRFQLPAGAGATLVPVPLGSGIISVNVSLGSTPIGSPIGEFDVMVQQMAAQGTIILKSYNPRVGIWEPLATGCDNIRLLQSAAAPATDMTVTFGIDG